MNSWIKRVMPEKIPAFGAFFYSWLPARMFVPYYGMIAHEIELKGDEALLDIGTGPGLLPLKIAERFPLSRIIGIDSSPQMIAIARRNKERRAGALHVEFRVIDANRLEFGDNSFDKIISTGSLHHWKNPVRILDEIYRCLKPGCEAWIYDGYGDAQDADIVRCTRRFFSHFPPIGMVKRILGLHGYAQSAYDTVIKDMIGRTPFGTCLMEQRGIMMRLRLRK